MPAFATPAVLPNAASRAGAEGLRSGVHGIRLHESRRRAATASTQHAPHAEPRGRRLEVVASSSRPAATAPRRAVLAAAVAAAAAALQAASVEPAYARNKRQSPLFLDLVPVLELRLQVESLGPLIDAGEVAIVGSTVKAALKSRRAEQLLYTAAAGLDTDEDEERARAQARTFIEYLSQVDAQGYYDSRDPSGAAQARLAEFSKKAHTAALAELDKFLRLMPEEQVEAAQARVQKSDF
eukprot:tig00000204_g17698.t1